MSAVPDDAAVEELLGAFALDACDEDETAAVEALLGRRPDLATESARLTQAAVWVGATEALEAPTELRGSVLARARARRVDESLDGPLRAYIASAERLEDSIDVLDQDDLHETTANGLDVRDLVVHLAAQESLLAQSIGASPVPEVDDVDVPARTAALVRHFAARPLDDVRALWRQSVDTVCAWGSDPATRETTLRWLEFDLPRDNVLVARAFENWIHRDDLRAATGRGTDPPPAAHLHEMADLSLRTMPMGLLASGRSRPGKSARVVLTGPGGGEWLVAMGGGDTAPDVEPDVTLTADVIAWCRVAGERLTADDLERTVEGDEDLAADLLAAAPAFATL